MHGQLGGLTQAHDTGDILSAGALAAFMAAAHQQRLDGSPTAHKHGAHTLGAVHLVGTDGEQMAADAAYVDLHLARALHRVNVEENAGVGGDFADLLNGLAHPGLVVGQHDAD